MAAWSWEARAGSGRRERDELPRLCMSLSSYRRQFSSKPELFAEPYRYEFSLASDRAFLGSSERAFLRSFDL